jgi:nitroreductase
VPRGGVWAAGTLRVVDASLALVTKRDTRRYAERAVPEAVVRRVLEGGRLAGGSRNRQPWRFVIVADPALRERLADRVYVRCNVRGPALLIAIVVSGRGAVNLLRGCPGPRIKRTRVEPDDVFEGRLGHPSRPRVREAS